MKKITFTQDEFVDMLSIFDVDLSSITARDILQLEELTPIKRDLVLAITEEQIQVHIKTLTNILMADAEEAQETMQ